MSMVNHKSSISSLLLVVALLVLTALTAVWYNGSEEENNKLNQNAIYQKAFSTIQVILSSSEQLASLNLNRNIGLGAKIKEEMETIDFEKISLAKDGDKFDSWSEFAGKVREEWQKEGVSGDRLESKDNFITWQKRDDQNFLIITLKNGQKYEVPVSAKWFRETSVEQE